MARRRLFLLPQAVQDFELVREPLRSQVVRRLRLLKRFPGVGVALVGAFSGWRATTVGLFRIVYRVTRRGVEVGYIRYCRRAFRGAPEED